jgi:serine/threonine protein kinase
MIGEQLDRWVIDEELGRGAMGTVYRAHAADDSAVVRAVKVLAGELTRDLTARLRFLRETEILKRLDHPHIVRFHEAGVQQDTMYYVMEFVRGPDGARLLRERGHLAWPEVLDIALQIVPALKHAHDQGIVHRDLQPSNLLIESDGDRAGIGRVKLGDFGVARIFTQDKLTGYGQLVGAAAYLAPEQAAGKPATKRSDFYSLGCLLYTLATGRPPFTGESAAELMHKHSFAQPERPARLVTDLPHDLDELIIQLLSKDPAQRPADGSVLRKQLLRIRGKLERKGLLAPGQVGAEADDGADGFDNDDEPMTPRSHETADSRGLFNRAWVIVPLFLVVIGLLIWKFSQPRPSAEEFFEKARPLLASDDPADWTRAWADYLEPMMNRHPDNPYQREVEELRQLLADWGEQRRLGLRRRSEPVSEGQRLYRRGLQLCQGGDLENGRRIWHGLVQGFGSVEAEKRWVRLAQLGLRDLPAAVPNPNRWHHARAALATARQLRDSGHLAQAQEIWQGLETLYGDDPAAKEIMDELRRDRDPKP